MRVAQWDAEAQLVRRVDAKDSKKVEPVKSVAAGTKLRVADAVTTGKKEIGLFAGAVGYQRIAANSAVRYVAFNPPSLDPLKKSTIELELTKGEVQHRTGKLATGSVYRSRSGTRLAASAGTAYSVTVREGDLEVLVAEGEVVVALASRADQTLTVGPRQKTRLGATLPAAATPVTPADEVRLRALLSLPISNVIGYTDPFVLTRADAEEIVTLQVRPRLIVERAAESQARWRPMSVVVPSQSTFWTVDETGQRREAGKGLTFLAASPNGDAVLGTDGKGALVTVDLQGRRWETSPNGFVKLLSLSPNGRRAVVLLDRWVAEFSEPEREGGGSTRTMKRKTEAYLINTRGGLESKIVTLVGVNLVGGADENSEFAWRQGSNRLFVTSRAEGAVNVAVPTNLIDDNTVTMARLDRSNPFSQKGDWEIEIPRSGHWVIARGQEAVVVADATFGASVRLTDVATIQELLDNRSLLVTFDDGSTATVERSSRPFEPMGANAGNEPQVYRPARRGLELLDESRALSPNGELVTFRSGTTGTVMVADSLNLFRNSNTYVGYGARYRCEWLTGDEVLYEPPADDGKEADEALLIRLGIKREGAVPQGFPVPPTYDAARPISLPEGSVFSEVILASVNNSGVAAGFMKTSLESPSGGFIFRPGRNGGTFPTSETVLLGLSEDGTAFGWNLAVLPTGRTVVTPPGSPDTLLPTHAVTPDGQILVEGNRIWDPKAGAGATFPVGDGLPYGGRVRRLLNVPEGSAAIGMNRQGSILYLSASDVPGPKALHVGRLDQPPLLFEARIQELLYGYRLGEDGSVYAVSGSVRGNRMINRIYRIRPTGEPVVVYETADQISLEGATKEGIVYGNLMVAAGGSQAGLLKYGNAFAVLDGEFVPLPPLMGDGWTLSIRSINSRGDIAGSVTKDGKPWPIIPNLYQILQKRK
jgi:hypothetical protein